MKKYILLIFVLLPVAAVGQPISNGPPANPPVDVNESVSTHNLKTDDVHGITNTALLGTLTSTVTDNAIIRGDGTARGMQKSGVTIDDSDLMTFPATAGAGIALPAENDAVTPTFALGSGAGIYQNTANSLLISLNGGLKWAITQTYLEGGASYAGRILGASSSLTTPYISNNLDTDTGVGGDGSNNHLSLIAEGVQGIGVISNSGAITRKFVGKSYTVPQTMTVADSGDGNPAADTLTPTSDVVQITCSDANGCDITMSETGATDGQPVEIICMTANTCNFADTAGVTEIAGAATLGQYDSILMRYTVDTWVQVGSSNN